MIRMRNLRGLRGGVRLHEQLDGRSQRSFACAKLKHALDFIGSECQQLSAAKKFRIRHEQMTMFRDVHLQRSVPDSVQVTSDESAHGCLAFMKTDHFRGTPGLLSLPQNEATGTHGDFGVKEKNVW